MFVACQGGHVNIVKELLNRGANVHVAMKVKVNLKIMSTSSPREMISDGSLLSVTISPLKFSIFFNILLIDGIPMWNFP